MKYLVLQETLGEIKGEAVMFVRKVSAHKTYENAQKSADRVDRELIRSGSFHRTAYIETVH